MSSIAASQGKYSGASSCTQENIASRSTTRRPSPVLQTTSVAIATMKLSFIRTIPPFHHGGPYEKEPRNFHFRTDADERDSRSPNQRRRRQRPTRRPHQHQPAIKGHQLQRLQPGNQCRRPRQQLPERQHHPKKKTKHRSTTSSNNNGAPSSSTNSPNGPTGSNRNNGVNGS